MEVASRMTAENTVNHPPPRRWVQKTTITDRVATSWHRNNTSNNTKTAVEKYSQYHYLLCHLELEVAHNIDFHQRKCLYLWQFDHCFRCSNQHLPSNHPTTIYKTVQCTLKTGSLYSSTELNSYHPPNDNVQHLKQTLVTVTDESGAIFATYKR